MGLGTTVVVQSVFSSRTQGLSTIVSNHWQTTAPEQVLRQKLRHELETAQSSIARDKADLMEGTKTSNWAMQLKLKREEELKERIAAFTVFNRNVARAKKLGGNLQVSCTSWFRGFVVSRSGVAEACMRGRGLPHSP